MTNIIMQYILDQYSSGMLITFEMRKFVSDERMKNINVPCCLYGVRKQSLLEVV